MGKIHLFFQFFLFNTKLFLVKASFNLKMGSFVVDKYRKVGSRGAHCISQTINQDKMRVKILPALSDNYMYLVSLIIVY